MLVSSPNSKLNINLIDRVVNQCLDRVTAPGTPIPSTSSYSFITSLLTHKTRRDFYHNGLYDMVANIIVQNPTKIHVSKASAVLWSLTKHSHVHYGLLDFMADKIAVRDPELIYSPKTSFTNILSAFALPSNYKPTEDIYKTILESTHTKLCKEKTKFLLFKMLRHLFVLKYYPKHEISDWFEKYFKEALTSSTIMGMRSEFLDNTRVLYQGICLESKITDCEELKQRLKPFVEELVAFESKEIESSAKSETLEFALAQGLGGKNFIASNLYTDFGHLVDHVVVMRKGGYPVPINKDQSVTYISELEVPVDAKVFGIISLTRKDFCREPNLKKGDTEFRLRTLKSCGVTPIAIHLDGWEALAEIEKIPYIMREIQENSSLNEK
ncbi:unnamed protein product [Medioppia subpectinata]|uniref:RAP domain-containing protein n=1 Tax=Medioppia subpectinata TaxID=1979941 RepID=A0A7R9QBR8_9ACAR|nr:unnamed protein product [Medioppia subpectinata]CAG2118061.1 unnamed protein product [Medioppia subpectinata]